MPQEWRELTDLIGRRPYTIRRVALAGPGTVVEGDFTPPPLAALPEEDQVFVAAFIRCHGSIKQMERYFGISYPTVKNRLNRIAEMLPLVEVSPATDRTEILRRLDEGTITTEEALAELDAGGKENES